MIAQQTGDNDSKLLRRCGRCGHVVVCSVFRAVGPLLQGWTDESRPFARATGCNRSLTISRQIVPSFS